MHKVAYRWLSAQPRHLLQKEVALNPGDGYLCVIGRFDISTLLPNIFFYEFEVDRVGVVGTEKIPVCQQILVLFEVP